MMRLLVTILAIMLATSGSAMGSSEEAPRYQVYLPSVITPAGQKVQLLDNPGFDGATGWQFTAGAAVISGTLRLAGPTDSAWQSVVIPHNATSAELAVRYRGNAMPGQVAVFDNSLQPIASIDLSPHADWVAVSVSVPLASLASPAVIVSVFLASEQGSDGDGWYLDNVTLTVDD